MGNNTLLNSGNLPIHWAVCRLGHLGDVVLTTGVLDYLAKTYGWDFICITRKAFADVFTHTPHVSRVVGLDDKDLDTAAFAGLSRRLAAEFQGYGLLDLHGNLRSRLLSAFWRGPVLRYPKKTLKRRLFLLSDGRAYGEDLRHSNVPQRYYMAVHKLGGPLPAREELLPRIRLSEEERLQARQRLDQACGEGSSPVALHPFATHALKAWPETHWRALVAQLNAAFLPWVALGKGQALFPGNPGDLSNATTLRESCALLSWCRLLVTGDSGPMHLAAAVGTPVLALFGPTTREWGFYPAGPRDRVLEREIPCRPCSLHGRKPCPENGQCLAGISPGDVFTCITEQLSCAPAKERPGP